MVKMRNKFQVQNLLFNKSLNKGKILGFKKRRRKFTICFKNMEVEEKRKKRK
jgi:hypothetical protein